MSADYIILENKAKKQLEKLPLRVSHKILTTLKKLKDNPTLGIKLHGELEKYYKYRVGDYRVVYSFTANNKTINVLKIEHRQGVYK